MRILASFVFKKSCFLGRFYVGILIFGQVVLFWSASLIGKIVRGIDTTCLGQVSQHWLICWINDASPKRSIMVKVWNLRYNCSAAHDKSKGRGFDIFVIRFIASTIITPVAAICEFLSLIYWREIFLQKVISRQQKFMTTFLNINEEFTLTSSFRIWPLKNIIKKLLPYLIILK